MTEKTKTQTILDLLLAHKTLTSSKIATMTGYGQQEVANMLRKWRKAKKYGVCIKGSVAVSNQSGPPQNLWAVDKRLYEKYVADRSHRGYFGARTFAHLIQKPPVRIPSARLPPGITLRTMWQPSSPYFREAANERQ